MFGLISVAAKSSPLEWWGSVWAIVAGVLALAAFAGGIGGRVLTHRRRPRLILETGDGRDFNRTMLTSLPHIQEWTEGKHRTVLAAHAKFLRVRETKGRSHAGEVMAYVTDVDPPSDDDNVHLPRKLMWWSGEYIETIPAGQTEYLFLDQIALMDNGGCTASPGFFGHHSPLEFEITLYMGGRPHAKARFEMEDGWPGLSLLFWKKEQTVPDPFPFPRIKKL